MSELARAEKIAKKATKEQAPPKQSEIARAARLMFRFTAGQRRNFLVAGLMLVLEALTAVMIPLVIAYLIDGYLTPRLAQLSGKAVLPPLSPLERLGLPTIFDRDIDTVGIVTIGIVMLTMLNSATDSFAEIFLAQGGRLLGLNLRVALYGHLQRLSLAFYGQQRTGDLLTRVTGDVTALEDFVVTSLSDIVGSILLIGFILGTIILNAWQVAIIAAFIIPIMAVVSNYFSQRIKSASKKQRAREGELAGAAQEMLTSIRVIQTYGRAGNLEKKFAAQSRKTMESALEAAGLQARFSWVTSVLEAVATAAIIWLGVWLIFGSNVGVGVGLLVAFIRYIQDMFKPTKKIIKEWNTFGKIYASVERIGEIFDRQPAVKDEPGAREAPRFVGNIEYRHVSFAYQIDPDEATKAPPRLALRDVSFSIAPGEVVALVGSSGAGKSTIAQLLPRLYDPPAGQILIDGQDLRSFTLDSLRAQMSMVLQEAILFTGTIADNISYGRENATREEIVAAAMQANAHEFIEKLPDGYDTVLGERASNLSGGQRQRIAIARAFIRNTPILILDEPTTGLDAESTDLVLTALRELMRGKATVIISHDLNLIRHADTILVVKQGEIAQSGSHRQLLKAGGLYADLYHKQFGQAVEEQGGQFKPIEAPAVVAAKLAEPADDEDEVVETPRAFQTLIGRALPAPVEPKVFQTLMMQAKIPPPPAPSDQPAVSAKPLVPAPAQSLAPATPAQPAPVTQQPQPAPVASPKPAVAPPPQPAPVAQQPQPAPVAPPKPAVAPPPQPAPVAQQPRPAPVAPPKPAVAPQPPAASSAAPQAAKPAGNKDQAAPKPTIFATTVMRTIPEDLSPSERAALAGQTAIPTTAGQPTIQVRGPVAPPRETSLPFTSAQLDLLNSPVVQSELPGLRTAFDAEAMRGYLQSALFGKARANYTVEKCAPGKAIYMGDSCVLRYELVVKETSSGQTLQPLIVGRLFGDQLACAVYMRDKLAPLAELMRGRAEIAPFANPIAMIEPLVMVVYAFPIDGELPTLVGATDRQRVMSMFAETLPEALTNNLIVEDCRMVPVNYARRHRCVLRYEIEGLAPGNKLQRRQVYGKVATDSQGALIAPVVNALRERLLTNAGARVNVPRSLGYRPDLQISLLEGLPGSPRVNQLLKDRLNGQSAADGALTLEAAIEECARIAAALHASDIRLGRKRTLDDDFAALQKEIGVMQRVSPELGAQFQAWLERAENYSEESDPLRLCFSHGDYTHAQVIFDGASSGLVDFDTVCQAEPALDLGQFMAYMRVAAHKARRAAAPGSTPIGEQLAEHFLNSYIAAAGPRLEDADRLRVRAAAYQVVSLMRMALHSWQQIKPARVENALAVLQEALDGLPQLDY